MRRLKLLLVGASMVGVSVGARATETITVVSWGGAYEHSQTEAYFKPFTRKTGIEIQIETYRGGIEELRRQVEAGKVTWDLVDMTMADNIEACDAGLLEPFDHSQLASAPDGTPPEQDFIDGALIDCGVSQIVFATVLAYNRDAFPGEKPSTTKDLFDTERFPGKRALQREATANFEWALRSYGVPRQELYSLLSTARGIRLAFAKLDTIKRDVVWWTDPAEPARLLANGDVVIASGFNGRLSNATTVEGHPIEIIWDASLYEFDTWAIPKGAQHREQVIEFIRFATDTQRLADQAKYIAYGPTRKSSNELLAQRAWTGVDMRPHLPTTPANFKSAIRKDDEWYAKIHTRVKAQFDDWLGAHEK